MPQLKQTIIDWSKFTRYIVGHTNTIAHETYYTLHRHRKGLPEKSEKCLK